MAFKMKGYPMKGDPVKEAVADPNKIQIGGRFKESIDGKDRYPTSGEKTKEVEAHLKEFKAGGATDAEVKAERKRLMSAIMANIRK